VNSLSLRHAKYTGRLISVANSSLCRHFFSLSVQQFAAAAVAILLLEPPPRLFTAAEDARRFKLLPRQLRESVQVQPSKREGLTAICLLSGRPCRAPFDLSLGAKVAAMYIHCGGCNLLLCQQSSLLREALSNLI